MVGLEAVGMLLESSQKSSLVFVEGSGKDAEKRLRRQKRGEQRALRFHAKKV